MDYLKKYLHPPVMKKDGFGSKCSSEGLLT
jgi:hypothetical protein